MTLHVEVDRHKILRAPFVQIARDRQRFEEHLRHDDGAADVQDDAAIVDRRKRGGESPEIAVTRVANGGAVRRWMLVNDLGADGGVDSHCDAESKSLEQN